MKQLCAQFNVGMPALKQQIRRGKWATMKVVSAQHRVTITKQVANAASKAITENSLRPALHKLAHAITHSKPLTAIAKTISQAESQARVALTLTQTAKVLEGWSDTTEQVISIDLVRSMDSLPIQPCIDVGSTVQPALPGPEVASELVPQQPISAPANPADDGTVPTHVSRPELGS